MTVPFTQVSQVRDKVRRPHFNKYFFFLTCLEKQTIDNKYKLVITAAKLTVIS